MKYSINKKKFIRITKASNETQAFSRIPSNSAKRVTELVRTKSSCKLLFI